MTEVAAAAAAIAGVIGFLGVIALLLFIEPIGVLLIVRELRKQAAMLPEDRREAYLREGLAALDDGLREHETPPLPTPSPPHREGR